MWLKNQKQGMKLHFYAWFTSRLFDFSIKVFFAFIDFLLVLPSQNFGTLSDGVTGNTSGFGSEESRFEPWSDNSPR